MACPSLTGESIGGYDLHAETFIMTNTGGPAYPSVKTIKRLFTLSGNRCAFPQRMVQLIRNSTVIGEICHIKSANPGGPRYDISQSDEERHDFNNLILLCRNHHVEVDGDERAYTVSRLLEMKQKHEASATTIADTEATSGATLLLSIAQAGGIVAQSVHVETLNLHPGADTVDREAQAEAARAYFAPELARVVARQVYLLGRTVPNFTATSVGKAPVASDNWPSLKPSQPSLSPAAGEFRNLRSLDATSLIEFYDSLHEITEIINTWTESRQTNADVNAWNFLMQKVQNSLRLAQNAVRRFCPDRAYDATMPASGTLLYQIQRSISISDNALRAHLTRHGVT
jgi:hypothetical protein